VYEEWSDCPVVSATPETLYEVLNRLITDDVYRAEVGLRSREFALRFLDVRKNVIELENLLGSL
jgi:hypothetical protein